MFPNFANTIISGKGNAGTMNTVVGIFHLALWIIAAVLGIYVNGLVHDYMNGDNGYPNVPNEERPITGTTNGLGITSTASIFIGIVLILIHAGIEADSQQELPLSCIGIKNNGDLRRTIEAPIIATTTFSTVVTIYIFGLAGKNPESKYFDWAFAAVIVQVWAQLLLCANLKEVQTIEERVKKTTMMNFMAAIVTSVEIVTTAFVLSHDAVSDIQDRQKAVVLAAPFLAGLSFFMKTVQDYFKLDISVLKSLTKLAYVAAMVCTFYKLSLVTLQQSNPTFYMFTLLNVLMSTALFVGIHTSHKPAPTVVGTSVTTAASASVKAMFGTRNSNAPIHYKAVTAA